MSLEEHPHKAKVTNRDGSVFISLMDDEYIKMTPEQAQQIAGRLFIQAAAALGKARPEVIVLR